MNSSNGSQAPEIIANGLRRLVLALPILLVFVSLGSAAQAGQAGDFQLYALEEGVNMPFPQRPSRLGSTEQEGVTQHLYQFADEESGIGVTATVMRDVMTSSSDVQAVLRGYLSDTVEVMGGHIVSEGAVSIADLPARKVVIHMDQYHTRVRSHTVAVFDEGRMHTWAIQDIPQLTGNMAERMFESNIRQITVAREAPTDQENQSAFQLYEIEGLYLPFPDTPTRSQTPYGAGTLTMWSYMDRESNILFYAGVAEGLPAVSDPPASFLRGAARGNRVIASEPMQVAGKLGRYHIIEGEASGQLRRTYMVAFESDGKIFSWAAHEDPAITGGSAREIFFQEVQRIDSR